MILFVVLVNCRGHQFHSWHSCGYQLCSYSRQHIPLLVNNRLHTGASQRKEATRFFNFTFRYIDDVILLINSKFDEIKDYRVTARSPSYLDLHLEIDNECRLRTKLYDKRYDFNFLILNFPFVATFQQHLYMEFIYFSWSDIPERMVPIMITLIEDCC